jgi:hypothetical protein
MTQDEDNNFFKRWILINAQANPPEEWRNSFKLIVSALLAVSLWGFLGVIAFRHFQASSELSRQLAATDSQDNGKIDNIEKAFTGINDTAKTLYTLITPLATAITGYFFAISGSQSTTTITPTSLSGSQSTTAANPTNLPEDSSKSSS